MKIQLEGPEVDEYNRLLMFDHAFQQFKTEVLNRLTHLEDTIMASAQDLKDQLAALSQKLTDVQTHIESVVTEETAEDVAQQQQIKDLQDQLAGLQTQLAASVSPADAALIQQQIDALSAQIDTVNAAVRETPPTPAPDTPPANG